MPKQPEKPNSEPSSLDKKIELTREDVIDFLKFFLSFVPFTDTQRMANAGVVDKYLTLSKGADIIRLISIAPAVLRYLDTFLSMLSNNPPAESISSWLVSSGIGIYVILTLIQDWAANHAESALQKKKDQEANQD